MGVIDMVNGKLCETLPIEEIEQIRNESYNQALEDMRKAILTDKELQFAPYSQDMWFRHHIMDITERLIR